MSTYPLQDKTDISQNETVTQGSGGINILTQHTKKRVFHRLWSVIINTNDLIDGDMKHPQQGKLDKGMVAVPFFRIESKILPTSTRTAVPRDGR